MSTLGVLNRYLLQWFYIRLCKTTEAGSPDSTWEIMYWVKPKTGWDTNYKWVKSYGPKYLRIW